MSNNETASSLYAWKSLVTAENTRRRIATDYTECLRNCLINLPRIGTPGCLQFNAPVDSASEWSFYCVKWDWRSFSQFTSALLSFYDFFPIFLNIWSYCWEMVCIVLRISCNSLVSTLVRALIDCNFSRRKGVYVGIRMSWSGLSDWVEVFNHFCVNIVWAWRGILRFYVKRGGAQ